ncbi:hypothetical protein ACTQ6A_15800 [Lachnospiraceae bacterium LCP25S3_G4]
MKEKRINTLYLEEKNRGCGEIRNLMVDSGKYRETERRKNKEWEVYKGKRLG